MILVTGATGNVGREVVNLLLSGGEKVVALTRHPEKAALPEGAVVVGGDPSHPQTLTKALRDVEAILVSPRALGDATAGAATAELLKLAAEQGAPRVVVLSAATVEYGGGYERFAAAFKAVEDAARTSGLPWTFLRSTDYASNSLAWVPQIRSTGIVRGAYGDGATATIHERDVAAVATRALLDAAHAGHSYVLTGPQLLSQRDKGYCSDLTSLLYSGHDDGRADRLSQRKTESRVGRTESDARRTASDEGRAASHARKATRRSGAHRRTGN